MTGCGNSSKGHEEAEVSQLEPSSFEQDPRSPESTDPSVSPGDGTQTTTPDTTPTSNTEPPATLNRATIAIVESDVTVVSAAGQSAEMTVLFLHGAAFTSETWVENGILTDTATANIDAVAVDLPGFGSSPRSSLANDKFLVELISELGLDPARIVIVSPSMSGGFSLPALRDPLLSDLAGYVPIAPVGVTAFLSDGSTLATPALVIWGDQDGSDPRSAAENLASGFSEASVLILPNAGHAAYQHQPDLFTEALVNFVRSVELS